jgi:hypothetical protein
MPKWVRSAESSYNKPGLCQWYLCESLTGSPGRIVGEVVLMDPDGVRTYYAELTNGRGLRYFTNEDDAKAWLWSFYLLEKASCD